MPFYFASILLVSLISGNSGLSNDILVRLQELTTRIEEKIDNITKLEEIVSQQEERIHQLETNSSGSRS